MLKILVTGIIGRNLSMALLGLMLILTGHVPAFANCTQGNCVNGKGVYTFPDGSRYEGQFKDSLPNGQGASYLASGGRYEGQFRNGLPNGQGIAYLPDGSRFEGQFKDGLPVPGQVVPYPAAGGKPANAPQTNPAPGKNQASTGCQGNCANGQGIYTFPDGSRYEGQFKNGAANGQGIFYFANGSRYEGQFKDNQPDGQGTAYDAQSGQRHEGQFKNGLLNGQGTTYWADGQRYEGQHKDGKMDGQGILYLKDGGRYEGQFKDDHPSQGTQYFTNGDRYEGQFQSKRGERNQSEVYYHGQGTLYHADGRVERGLWENDKLVKADNAVPPEKKPANPPPSNDRRLALVIGNAAYPVNPLANAGNDAKDIADRLNRLGFNVTLQLDASQENMEKAIADFSRALMSAGASAVGLFYYSGHAVQLDDHNYLLPVNADIRQQTDLRYKAVNVSQVIDAMNEAGSDINLVILDACRDNPLPRSFGRGGARGLARTDGGRGTLIAFATSPGKTADDGNGRNGTFTKHLLQNLVTPGLSVEEVFKRVRQGVTEETHNQQVPWTTSSLIRDFYFVQ